MAKKKSGSAATTPLLTTNSPPSVEPPASKSPTTKPVASKPPAKKASVGKPAARLAICHEQIGQVAGHIWQHLDSHGETTLPDLKKSVAATSDLVLAAIGWLAREDKLVFHKSGRSVKVALR